MTSRQSLRGRPQYSLQFPLDLIYLDGSATAGTNRVARFRGTELLQLSQTFGYALYISDIAGHFGYGYMFLWWTATGWLVTCLLAQKWAGEKSALSKLNSARRCNSNQTLANWWS